jgi:hypothetical protein
MANEISILRALWVYSICIPLAIFLGYVLASPMTMVEYIEVGIVVGLLLLPLLLKYHQAALVLAWNTTAVIFFLPGRPNIWILLAGASFLIMVLRYALSRRAAPINVPLVTWPLALFSVVVLVTAVFTGWIGFGAMGSEMAGGKRYIILFAAIFGYFALSANRIPLEKANLFLGLFFLGGVTLAIGSMPPFVPSDFAFIFWVFPVDTGAKYLTGLSDELSMSTARLWGVANGCMFVLFYMLGRYGFRGMLYGGRPWRLAVFLAFFAGSLLGGYRSLTLLAVALFAVQFLLEGLHRTKLLPLVLLGMVTVFALSLPFSTKLPYSFQRALSILGMPVSAEVEFDTRTSTEWRLRMWKQVAPQIPEYLLLGKGYGLNVRDALMMRDEFLSHRAIDNTANAQFAQEYHSGPLSVIIPLGIWGGVTVLWFWFAGFRLLLANYRHGAPELKTINTLLLAFFIAKIFHFLVVFGSLYLDFYVFTGIVGFGVALNGGLAKRAVAPAAQPVPGLRRPAMVLPHSKPAFGS